MQTHRTAEVDLSLEAEDAEPCYCCGKEATGYVEYRDRCACFINPAPICEYHYKMIQFYLTLDGPDDWQCGNCGHNTSVVGLYRRTN